MGRPDIHSPEIERLCSVPVGRTQGELVRLSSICVATINAKLPKMMERGQLHRRGTRKRYRYFTHLAHAQAWEQASSQVGTGAPARKAGGQDRYTHAILLACRWACGLTPTQVAAVTGAHPSTLSTKLPELVDAGKLRRQAHGKRWRYITEPAHVPAAETPQVPAAPKAPAPARNAPTEPARLAVAPKRGRGKSVYALGNHRPALDQLPPGGSVTWPAHVRVTVAPTPRDTRFTFDPPPGWRGEFGREWQQKRGGRS